jgi:hypothetical protein
MLSSPEIVKTAMEFAVNRFDLARLMTPARNPKGRSFFMPGKE